MMDMLCSDFRTQFLRLWKEFRFRNRLPHSDPKYWNRSVFSQKVRMAYLEIFGVKRLTDQELLDRLGMVEYSVRNNSKVTSNLIYYNKLSEQFQTLKNEFNDRLNGTSYHMSLQDAIEKSQLKIRV